MNNTQQNRQFRSLEEENDEYFPKRTTKRQVAFIPIPGQPGGKDDKNRNGLSGCGIKWYLRFLKRGVPPKIARKFAKDPNRKTIEETLRYKRFDMRDSSEERTEDADRKCDKNQDRLNLNKEGLTDSEQVLYMSYIALHFDPEEARGKVMHQRVVAGQNSQQNLPRKHEQMDFSKEKPEKRRDESHSAGITPVNKEQSNQELEIYCEKHGLTGDERKRFMQYMQKNKNDKHASTTEDSSFRSCSDPSQKVVEDKNSLKNLSPRNEKIDWSKAEPEKKRYKSYHSADTTQVNKEQSEKELEMYCRKHRLTGSERIRFMECMKKNQDPKYATSTREISFRSCIDPNNTAGPSKSEDKDIDPIPRNQEARFCKEHKIQGAGRKWYMRYRSQGYSMDEAYQKLMERKALRKELEQGQEKERKLFVWRRDPEASTSKSISSFPTRNGPPLLSSPADASQYTQIAILPEEYPKYTLAYNDLAALEGAIVAEVTRGWKVNLVFRGIKYGPGMLLIDCENFDTAKWLTFVAPQLRSWRGVQLKACLKENLPKPYTVYMFLPNSAGQDIKGIFAQIGAQNSGLYVLEWEVVNVHANGRDQTIVFTVDHGSWATISKNDGVVRYGNGMVRLQRKHL